MSSIRSPICTVVGHVDHGKSSILDKIRGTSIVSSEPGAITQAIGASIVPLESIKKICGPLLSSLNMKFTIPGLLFIDTPGHAAFTNLRKRGGSLADIAILVVDINEGFKPQTVESVEILRASKTPFVVAANKLDLIPGWNSSEHYVIQNINKLPSNVKHVVETRIYEIVGKLAELGFESERFDRVKDYTRQIAIVPTSAKTGDGIPELLMVITGLAQKYLEDCLCYDVTSKAKGTVLEVKEAKGLGKVLDVILYDGTLHINDTIVIGGIDKPIVTKVKVLFKPKPLSEMRDKRSKFISVNSVSAASGVRISAPDLDNVIAGMPLLSATQEELEEAKQKVQSEVEDIIIRADKHGIVVKADTLGSLEAVIQLLKEKNVPIRKASVGQISKKDLSDAEVNLQKDPLLAVVLGFNVTSDIDYSGPVKIITNNVIYKLIQDFESWQLEQKRRIEEKELDALVRPCKIEVLRGYIFRQSNPAVFGVSVEEGTLRTGMPLMKSDGRELSKVRSIQSEQENIDKAERGKQVAIAMDNVIVGRHINEGDILYSNIPEEDFRRLKQFKSYLSKDEIEAIREISAIKRKSNPVWGV